MSDILDDLRALRADDLPTHGGHTLAYVYDSGLAGLDELAASAHALASSANALDPTAFPSLLRMENDLVAAAARLLGGGVGSVTSGGTESCLLAVLAAREARPDVAEPTIVLPSTAHAAFHKAAHLFRVRAVSVPVDPVTFRADPDAMAAAIGDSTVLVVASAPSYAHGVLDPVAPIAAAAARRGVRMHVDACIGGWVLPYFRRLGRKVPDFGFGVDGVTSISVDLHKYAYCPKGVSVLPIRPKVGRPRAARNRCYTSRIAVAVVGLVTNGTVLHANAELRRGHYFASARWPGYTMLNTTIQSTRSGGPLAAAWAVLREVGDEGYLRLAEDTLASVTQIREGIEALDGLRVLGEPDSTLIAVTATTEDVDLFVVADEMRERGWYVQPQFAHLSSPVNLHLTVTAANRGSEAEFLAALRDSVAAARVAGPVVLDPDVAAFVAALDPATLTPDQFAGLLAAAGLTGGAALPSRMAEINTLLAQASPALRERLLLEFLGELYRPTG